MDNETIGVVEKMENITEEERMGASHVEREGSKKLPPGPFSGLKEGMSTIEAHQGVG